jgi:hypothetical protein
LGFGLLGGGVGGGGGGGRGRPPPPPAWCKAVCCLKARSVQSLDETPLCFVDTTLNAYTVKHRFILKRCAACFDPKTPSSDFIWILRLPWRNRPARARAASFFTFRDHTVTSQSVGCVTTHNTHSRQTSMTLAGFEPTVPTNELPHTARPLGLALHIHIKPIYLFLYLYMYIMLHDSLFRAETCCL